MVISGRLKSYQFLSVGLFGGDRLEYDQGVGQDPKRRSLGRSGALHEVRHGYSRLFD